MKMASDVVTRLIPVAFAGLLAACTTTPSRGTAGGTIDHKAHHFNTSASPSPSQHSPATAGNQRSMMGSMDMQAMCDMHKDMMNSKSLAERQAMMEQRMKSMSPEMRRQHMEMMEVKCK